MLCPIDIFDERYLNSAGRVEMYVVEQHVEYLDNSFRDTFRMTKRSFEALLRLLATQRNEDFLESYNRKSSGKPSVSPNGNYTTVTGHPTIYDDRRRNFNLSKGSVLV